MLVELEFTANRLDAVMLKAVKQNLLKLAKYGGALELTARSGYRRNRLLILAYHGVSLEDEHLWNSSLFVPQDFLRRRFELIKRRRCNVLPLAEALEKLYDRRLPERAVSITFDDGMFNFFEKALPVIKEYDFPATVYLTSYYSQYNRPVFPGAADYLLWKAGAKELNLRPVIGLDENIDLADPVRRKYAHARIVAHARDNNFSAAEKNDLLAQLCNELGIGYEEFCNKRTMSLMCKDEVSHIASEGIDVQLHTHRHRVPREREEFLRELYDNRDAIASMTGRNATHLCYPSGEFDQSFFEWLKEAEIDSATTCEVALCSTRTDPYLLPRLVDTMPLSDIEFEGWLTGASQFLPQRAASSGRAEAELSLEVRSRAETFAI